MWVVRTLVEDEVEGEVVELVQDEGVLLRARALRAGARGEEEWGAYREHRRDRANAGEDRSDLVFFMMAGSSARTHLVKSPVLILYVINTEIAESVLVSQHPISRRAPRTTPARTCNIPAYARLVPPEQCALRGGDYAVDRGLDAEAGVHALLCAFRVSAERRGRGGRGGREGRTENWLFWLKESIVELWKRRHGPVGTLG